MNITKLKEIVNESGLTDEMKERMILSELSNDPDVSNYLILMLGIERKQMKELKMDANLEISRYHVHLKNPKWTKENREFLNEETKNFYEKWKDYISPLFNNEF